MTVTELIEQLQTYPSDSECLGDLMVGGRRVHLEVDTIHEHEEESSSATSNFDLAVLDALIEKRAEERKANPPAPSKTFKDLGDFLHGTRTFGGQI